MQLVMGALLLGGVFPSIFEGGSKLSPEDWVSFRDVGGLGGVCARGASTQSSTRGPLIYESAMSTQSKGTVMAGWLRLLSL